MMKLAEMIANTTPLITDAESTPSVFSVDFQDSGSGETEVASSEAVPSSDDYKAHLAHFGSMSDVDLMAVDPYHDLYARSHQFLRNLASRLLLDEHVAITRLDE
jgi:hypothetical protein